MRRPSFLLGATPASRLARQSCLISRLPAVEPPSVLHPGGRPSGRRPRPTSKPPAAWSDRLTLTCALTNDRPEGPEIAAASTLLVATTNDAKLQEIRTLLADLPIELVTLARWPDLAPPEETGRTFAENARLKARYYTAATGFLAVAEDSGLEIDALGGAPGVESARFGGTHTPYAQKFALIYERLRADPAARLQRAVHLRARARRGRRRPVRDAGHCRRTHRSGTERRGRIRLRSDLLLPAVRMHARRGRRSQVGRKPSWSRLSRAPRLPHEDPNA